MNSLQDILKKSEDFLSKHHAQSPRVEAEWLVAHALDLKRLELYLQFDRPLSESELARIRPLIRRRADGEPLQYILGTVPFHDIELAVGPGVLVPRPETEILVEQALKLDLKDGEILDLCTGSGAILLALFHQDMLRLSSRQGIGIDLSEDALHWARKNADDLQLSERVSFLQGDLFSPVAGKRFALITANPPYVTDEEYLQLPHDIRKHEPRLALTSGADGLDLIRRLVTSLPDFLLPGGWFLMEIGECQGAAVKQLLVDQGLEDVAILKDYPGKDRIAKARLAE